MSSHPETFSGGSAWYTEDGPEKDVVVSTRVRLARNLANFAFPTVACKEDCEHVQALVFDSFSKMDNPERYQCVGVDQLDFYAKQLLAERGILPERNFSDRNINLVNQDTTRKFEYPPGLVIRTDGRASCLVNGEDHVRLSAFTSGFDVGVAYHICRELDSAMQKNLQFAASYDFGFLTAYLSDTGSGMKLSVWLLLPALMQMRRLKEVSEALAKQGCTLAPAFGSTAVPFGSLGACYKVSTCRSFSGSEEDQITDFMAAVNSICVGERHARSDFLMDKPTVLRHLVMRMFAVARYSRFLECGEALEIVSVLHLGLCTGLLRGVTHAELHALLFRVRNAHMEFLRRGGTFVFEDDVEKDNSLVAPRLRALLVQETMENIQICA